MEALTHGQPVRAGRSSLTEVEKRRVLENFVENDEALGQLLDFISSHYIQPTRDGRSGTEHKNPFQQSHSVSTLSSKQSDGKPHANNASYQFQMQKKQQALRGLQGNMSGAYSGDNQNAQLGSTEVFPGKAFNTQQMKENTFSARSKDPTELSGVNESLKDNESVGIESSFRFKGRGSDFQVGSPNHKGEQPGSKNQKLIQSFGTGYYKPEKQGGSVGQSMGMQNPQTQNITAYVPQSAADSLQQSRLPSMNVGDSVNANAQQQLVDDARNSLQTNEGLNPAAMHTLTAGSVAGGVGKAGGARNSGQPAGNAGTDPGQHSAGTDQEGKGDITIAIGASQPGQEAGPGAGRTNEPKNVPNSQQVTNDATGQPQRLE